MKIYLNCLILCVKHDILILKDRRCDYGHLFKSE